MHLFPQTILEDDLIPAHSRRVYKLPLQPSLILLLLQSSLHFNLGWHHQLTLCIIIYSIPLTATMRFQLLLISFASFFILSLGNPEDVLNIQKLNNDFAVFFDSNRKSEIVTLFTANLTYNIFTKTRKNFTVRGGPEFTRLISDITTATTQIAISTQSYTLQPPFDALGGAIRATGYSNFNAILFKDNKTQFFGAVTKDKYVKTTDFTHYGGWKIDQRDWSSVVSCNCSSYIWQASHLGSISYRDSAGYPSWGSHL